MRPQKETARREGGPTSKTNFSRHYNPCDYAVRYAALGWPVLPLAPSQKTPIGSYGLNHATVDEAVIRDWFTRWPDAGIGIALAPAGLAAIDIDPRNGGSIDALPEQLDTLTAETGGGGLHILVRVPPGAALPGKRGPGVDIKHRGYVVVEPSRHPSGQRYGWIDWDVLAEAPPEIVEAPAWLLRPPEQAKTGGAKYPDWLNDLLNGESVHESALRIVGAMVAKGLDDAAIHAWFEGVTERVANERGIERAQELTGPELGRMIAGARRKGYAQPPIPEIAANVGWPDPQPIRAELPPVPAFAATALLPPALADYVLDEADRMPCPPDYIAAALMVAIGSVLGSRCALKPKRRDDWIVTPNLFGGVVGDPSSKKSPGVEKGLRFLDRLEADEADRLAHRMVEFEAEMAAHKARETAVAASMKKAAGATKKPESGDAMAAAVADMKSLVAPEEPHARRFRTNDATIEKIGDILAHSPEGILVFRDELVGLLAGWEREGRESDRSFYLEGWNGQGSFAIDRIGRGSLLVRTLNLSVFGGIQPDLLGRYLAGIVESADNDGRIQRFQVLVFPDAVPWEWRDRYPVQGARETVRDMFLRMAAFDPVQDGATPATDFVKIPHFELSDAAQATFIEWSTELHTSVIAGEENPLLQQHFAKYEKLFCSVALILHLAEGRIGDVQADTALRAAAWCKYLAGHARRVYALLETAKVAAAQTLGRRIAAGKLPDPFTAREVMRKGWTGLGTANQIEGALGLLEEFGHAIGIDSDDGPGRPTTRYAVNPALKKAARP